MIVLILVHSIGNAQDEDTAAHYDLFGSDEVLDITLSGNMKELMDDRGDDSQYHPFRLNYSRENLGTESIIFPSKPGAIFEN